MIEHVPLGVSARVLQKLAAMKSSLALILCLSLSLVACGGRTLQPEEDGAVVADGGLQPDIGGTCKRPADGCFSNNDCKAGYTCQGCGGDPCCPTCAVCYGRCKPIIRPPVQSCSTNQQCAKGEYCKKDDCKAKDGTCAARPQNCTSHKDPVCGCDNKIHGNACAAAWAGANVAYKGACKTCSELNTEYTEAVVKAKACNPLINKLQCTQKVDNNLGCPCPTYIEPGNPAALAALNLARHRWEQQGCTQWDCGMSCGKPPTGGACLGRSQNGVCTDQYK